MITRGYLALARLQQARGQYTQALQTLDAFAQLSQQHGFAPVMLARGSAVGAQIHLAQGNLQAALRWAEISGVSTSDAFGYPQEQEYLTLVRLRIAQGRAQPAGPFLAEALNLLERLGDDAEAKERMHSLLEILLLRALALEAKGDTSQALTVLGRALALAAPEGYIRLFVDEGAPLLSLLRLAYRHRLAPADYMTTLLKASGEPMTETIPVPSTSLPEALMRREREVLQLLVNGFSNREIAQQLVLSVHTVKKHVSNICGKLGVQSRTQVIARARSLNLL